MLDKMSHSLFLLDLDLGAILFVIVADFTTPKDETVVTEVAAPTVTLI